MSPSAAKIVTALALMLIRPALPGRANGPSHVDITWMSVTNMYYQAGPLRIVTDGYITRLPHTWRLDRSGITPLPNGGVKSALGFTKD